ncbi:MAG: hypothetical protein EBE86_023690 [Hormoscilla sp. GUM202]|nr:hypothetical protein [Hormoscilla sp. GUM202]
MTNCRVGIAYQLYITWPLWGQFPEKKIFSQHITGDNKPGLSEKPGLKILQIVSEDGAIARATPPQPKGRSANQLDQTAAIVPRGIMSAVMA